MSGSEKAAVLARVASSGLPKCKILDELGVPRSTYYRWQRRKEQQGLEDKGGGGKPPWNKLTSREVHRILSAARGDAGAELQAVGSMDHRQHGLSASESTVYRISARRGSGEEG